MPVFIVWALVGIESESASTTLKIENISDIAVFAET